MKIKKMIQSSLLLIGSLMVTSCDYLLEDIDGSATSNTSPILSDSSSSSNNLSSSSNSTITPPDNQEVEKVNQLIAGLPNPSINNEIVKEIFAVQEAYTNLSEDEKVQVENYTKLENSVSEIYNLVKEKQNYSSKYEVALHIFLYDSLPGNFVTKSQANQYGWKSGSLWKFPELDGKSIGGDRFYNKEGHLPNGTYYECDIDYKGGSRNAYRIVYSLIEDTIYYTADHYDSFEQLY